MWSTESGHRVKALKCHNEVNDDSRNEKTAKLHGRLQAGRGVAGDRVRLHVGGGGTKPDINSNLLGRWMHRFEEEISGTGLNADEREELKRLRNELAVRRRLKELFAASRGAWAVHDDAEPA